jgi:hypothetical protein
MNKICAFSAAAKAASLVIASVLLAPMAFAVLMQAAQIVA